MRYALKTERDRQSAIDTAMELRKLLLTLNVWDVTALCAQFTREHDKADRCVHPESVYGLLAQALLSTLRLLGIPEGEPLDDAMDALLRDGCDVRSVIKAYAVEE